jgi:hypothetical protein
MHSSLWHYMEGNDEVHVPAALLPNDQQVALSRQHSVSAPEPM